MSYWLSEKQINAFQSGNSLSAFGEPRQGMATTDNKKYLRLWSEISYFDIEFNCESHEDIRIKSNWFPYNKGGAYRKWAGNNEFIVHYKNGGDEILDFIRKKYPRISDPEFVIKNRKSYFLESVTWSYISSTNLGVRYSMPGFIFDVSGSSFFLTEENCSVEYILGFLTSKLAKIYLDAVNPTMNIQAGDIGKLPLILNESHANKISEIVLKSIELAIGEWNSREKLGISTKTNSSVSKVKT